MSVAEHDLLLRATLGPDDTARDAYERWRAQADLATIDRASQRVLALLAERLGDQRDDAVAAKGRADRALHLSYARRCCSSTPRPPSAASRNPAFRSC